MKKGKNAVKIVAFLAIFLVILWQVQEWVTPDWDWPEDKERVKRSVAGVYAEPEESLKVLWLGTSHMQFGVSPMQIYEQTGIYSYNLATSMQSTPLSYYRLKSVLTEQAPQLVVMDVSSLFFPVESQTDDAAWRKVIDSLPWRNIKDKYEMICALDDLSMSNGMGGKDRISGILPIIKYHTNYAQIKEDICLDNSGEMPYYRKGHVIAEYTNAAGEYWRGTLEDLRKEYEAREQRVLDSGGVFTNSLKRLEVQLENNAIWMDKIQQLCKENDCELLLTKIPVYAYPTRYSGYWSEEKHDMVETYAAQRGLKFVDLNYESIDMDWKTDTWDGGMHLNEYGALKVSDFFSNYLIQNYEIELDESHKEMWDIQLELYKMDQKYMLMQTNVDAYDYFRTLQEGNFTVFMAVSDTLVDEWTDERRATIANVTGITTDIILNDHDSYVGIFENGVPLYETSSPMTCTATGSLKDGVSYGIESNGWYTNSSAVIRVGGEEYQSQGLGLRVVVYDNDLHCVVDSVTFDTRYDPFKVYRSNAEYRPQFYKAIIERTYEAMQAKDGMR